MHGVRQLAPVEVRASAPGGSDSMVSETFALREKLGMKSQLGAQLAHPAVNSAPAMAHTRKTDVIADRFPGHPTAVTQ
jgi:hypothetical protein